MEFLTYAEHVLTFLRIMLNNVLTFWVINSTSSM